MNDFFQPVVRQNLSDDLAHRIKQLIEANNLVPGDKLPTIAEMADRFDVGPPTLREALKKLETLGVVRIKHGSGIYVGENHRALFLTNPVISEGPSKKILLDLLEARTSIEPTSVRLAAENADEAHIARMEEYLDQAEQHLDNDKMLTPTNMAFHRAIAETSGNKVISQILQVLSELFQREQQLILSIYGSREKDHREHREILTAIKQRDPDRAAELMHDHLEGVRTMIEAWDPAETRLARETVE